MKWGRLVPTPENGCGIKYYMQVHIHQGGNAVGDGGMNWETGTDMYPLVSIKWRTKKNLLYK